MKLRNKFNGYSRDGVRLYNDPATLAIGAGLSTGTMAGTSLLATGALAGSTAALGTGLAAGLAAGGFGGLGGSLMGGLLPGGIAGQAGAGGLGSMMGAPAQITASGAPAFVPGATNAAAGSSGLAGIQPVAPGFSPASVSPDTAAFNFSQINAAAPPPPAGTITGYSTMPKVGGGGFETNQIMSSGQVLPAGTPVTPPVATPPAQPSVGLPDAIRNTQTQIQGNVAASPAPGVETIGPRAATPPATGPVQPGANWMTNLGNLIDKPSWQAAKDYAVEHPYVTSAAAALGTKALFSQPDFEPPKQDPGMIRPYKLDRSAPEGAYSVSPTQDTSERRYFKDTWTAEEPYRAASGGIASAYAVGGPVEEMSAMNAVGANSGYPMAALQTPMYSNPSTQRPMATNVLAPDVDAGVDTYTGEPRFARGGSAYNLGDYSDGGRLLKGPGDGVSDSIPASIGGKQPARLADGEFVVPARIVSELGNGSTEAGARKLYAMMERVQKQRKKSIGKGKVAVNSKADKHLPA